ncbi:MAG: peptidylprolyl isomerase [Flavobacteriales bacterium]
MKHIGLIILSLTALCLYGTAQQSPDAVIMTLENEQITARDFEYIFNKNNTEDVTTREALDEYIELFVNYKLKVKAAKDAQLDTNSAFIAELKGYRKQLARPYLTDTDLLDQLTREAYERKKTEVHARHMLVRVDADAEPEDTLRAWNKIKMLRDRVSVNGEDFEKVAKSKAGSEDPSVKDNGGDLGFFSAFQMVYPFEQAAYTTEVGNVSPILRTRYGYHILEVLEKRPARGEVLVAHIMTKAGNNSDQATQDRAKGKILEIYEKVKAGEPFDQLAKKFSEDASTSNKGGELPWFGTRKMVKIFEDKSFNLKNAGDISEPFQTEYGWHIVKKLDEKVIGEFDDLKSEIKSKVSKDARAEKTKKSFLNKLGKEYKVSTKPQTLKFINASVDSTFFTRDWEMKAPKKLKKKALTIEDQNFTLADFNKYMIKKKRRAGTNDPQEFITSTYENWVNDELLKYEDGKLEEKHDPFRMLMQEYRDGILLFELTDELVWSKAIKDSLGLENFYKNNSSKYIWPERYNCDLFSTNKEDVAFQILDLVNSGVSKDSISLVVNKSSILNSRVESGVYSVEDKAVLNVLTDKQKMKKGAYKVEFEGKFYVVNLKNIIPSKEKELDEAKGLITSDYQAFLEKQWIEELRSKYNYTVNKDVLYSLADD